MSKNKRPFIFKQFEVNHSRSSMKIGVDAVILGAWADLESAHTVLDVGCGCGVIALMAAQRASDAKIEAIDIDSESIEEAIGNFQTSKWSSRLKADRIDFSEYCEYALSKGDKFDYIISNPPFFDSGITNPDTSRLKARHQGLLSPEIILEKGKSILFDTGLIGIVVPWDMADSLKISAQQLGLYAVRSLVMTGRAGNLPKRCFMEFSTKGGTGKIGTLTIENPDGTFTDDYISLCRDFYIKF